MGDHLARQHERPLVVRVRQQRRNQIVTEISNDVGLALDLAEHPEQGIDVVEGIALCAIETEQDHR